MAPDLYERALLETRNLLGREKLEAEQYGRNLALELNEILGQDLDQNGMRQHGNDAKLWQGGLEIALGVAVKLKALVLLRDQSETFGWPLHDSKFDSSCMESICGCDDSSESLKVKLTLFPVLMRATKQGALEPPAVLNSKVILGI